jgi:serine/threonine-protein kinase
MSDTDSNRCPECGLAFPASVKLCPNDGSVLDEQAPAGSKKLGMVLDGKYRLDSYLSKGGMGSVYKATHVMLNKPVAVKMINAEIVSSPEMVRRFQREARAATTLSHPNIAGVFDLGQTSDGTLYIAMEFIDGPSLKSVLSKEGPMAPARIVSLLSQVSEALAVAHRHGVVHRDLKPHNIMLARDEHGREIAKLVDFGVAKTFEQATQLTQTGFVVGTPQYMAPEQAEGKPVDGRSDIYSLGVILYEMLSGDVPFDDPSTPMILIKHIKDAPVPPSVKNPDAHVSPGLEAVAMRCLQKDPAARFQSAEEFGSALNAVPLTPGSQQPTVRVDRTAVTVPTPMPQQKTAVGQTAPPLQTMNAPNTMSAPPVIADPQPSPAAVRASTSTPSSMAPVMIVAAVIAVGVIAGAWYAFGRSSSEPPAAPVTTTASSPPATAAPPAATNLPSSPPQHEAAPPASRPTALSPSIPAAPPTGNHAAASASPAVVAPAAGAPQPAAQPAQAPAAAAFPANPAVAFRCVGPNEICSSIRASVEEALQKAGMRALRDPGRADVVVEANVTPVSEHVNSDFGTALAVRTFSIDMIGEAPKLGDSVPMPSIPQLSYDPRFGAERVNEKARLVADGVVEKVKAFATKNAR